MVLNIQKFLMPKYCSLFVSYQCFSIAGPWQGFSSDVRHWREICYQSVETFYWSEVQFHFRNTVLAGFIYLFIYQISTPPFQELLHSSSFSIPYFHLAKVSRVLLQSPAELAAPAARHSSTIFTRQASACIATLATLLALAPKHGTFK